MSALMSHTTTPIRRRHLWRRVSGVVALMAATVFVACGKRIPGPATPTITLDVTNRGYFDVQVFVMPSLGANPVRLGTVTGSLAQTFKVKETDLQANGTMMVFVRTVAGRTGWTSPALSVTIGSVARLDVYSTSTGDLSQTRFYVQ